MRSWEASRLCAFAMVSMFFLSGCTTFGAVRSADARLGPSFALHASASTPPGEVAGWFWAIECQEACNNPVVGGDLGVTYGWRPPRGPRAIALGAGISGVHPYVDGYVQLAAGPRPFGLGARIGPPLWGWREHQVYARYDVPVGRSTRVLFNPAIFLHEGNVPNGDSPGRFLGFVQGVGLQLEGERFTWTPAVALVTGRGERNSYGKQYGPVWSVFATASLGVTFHRMHERRDR